MTPRDIVIEEGRQRGLDQNFMDEFLKDLARNEPGPEVWFNCHIPVKDLPALRNMFRAMMDTGSTPDNAHSIIGGIMGRVSESN